MDASHSPGRRPARGDLLDTLERLLDIQATEEKAALTQASSIISAALGADKVDIFLYEPAISSLVARGTSDTPMGRKQRELGLDRLPLANDCRSIEVYSTGQPHLTGRADQDPKELRGLVEGLGVRSRLAAPLQIDGVRRGTVEVCSATPDHFDEGDLRFLCAAARWIGALLHRLELGEEMRKRALAEGRRKAAEDIFAVLAHDLRNILASATTRLALIRERAARESRANDARDAGLLDSSMRRLVQMTSNLLDVSRLQRGLFSLDARLIDLVPVARQAVAALRQAGVTIEERYPESVMVNADPERLSQAIENLISNALKHSPPGGTVAVQLERVADQTGPRALLRVIDQGPGISAELLPHIFDRYVVGDGSHGLGLGLYLARGIALAHTGSLVVRPSEKGATFELSLPALE